MECEKCGKEADDYDLCYSCWLNIILLRWAGYALKR